MLKKKNTTFLNLATGHAHCLFVRKTAGLTANELVIYIYMYDLVSKKKIKRERNEKQKIV